jgi:hypothetical protein
MPTQPQRNLHAVHGDGAGQVLCDHKNIQGRTDRQPEALTAWRDGPLVQVSQVTRGSGVLKSTQQHAHSSTKTRETGKIKELDYSNTGRRSL